MELIATPNDDNRRIDRVLRKHFSFMSLSKIYKLIRRGSIKLNGRRVKPGTRVKTGDIININQHCLDKADYQPRTKSSTVTVGNSSGESVLTQSPLQIISETDDWLILSKPVNLRVHGPNSLDSLVQSYLASRIAASLSFRPGPLHRLDQNTSGLIVFSKSLHGAQLFSQALRHQAVRKRYLALVDGKLTSHQIWQDYLQRNRSKRQSFVVTDIKLAASSKASLARTKLWPLTTDNFTSLVCLEIQTGRTHQIRLQSAYHQHPLTGDRKYGGSRRPAGYLLHAYELIIDPSYDSQGLSPILAPPPAAFIDQVKLWFGASWANRLQGGLPSDKILSL